MDDKAKIVVLNLIKGLDLQEQHLPNTPTKYQQKWFRFGAYYAMKILAEKIEKL